MTKRLSLNDLLPSTDYAIRIRAVGREGVSQWSTRKLFTTISDTVLPSTPTGITWAFNTQGFHASWNEVTTNVDGTTAKIDRYPVELTHSGVTKIVQVQPENGTVYYDLPLQRAQVLFSTQNIGTISMRVRAVNFAGNKSAWSSSYNASAGAPDAPTNAVVTPITDGLQISWTPPANTSNLAGYHVYISTSGAGFVPSISNRIYEGTSPTCTYNTSTYSTHYIKIRSYSYWGAESSDLVASGTPISPYGPDTVAPDVPTSLAVSVDRSGAVARALVTWSFSATGSNSDIQAFAIRYRKTGDTNWFMEFAEKTARNLFVDLPQPYANYEFQISAVDFVANYSAWSSSVTLSAGVPGPPPQVTGVAVTPGFGDLQISWSQSANDDVTYGGYYEVQVSTNSGFTGSPLTYQTGNLSIAVAGLALSTTYWVRVRAVDVDGNQGTYSTSWTGSTTGVTIPSPTDGVAPSSSPAATATPAIGAIIVSWPPISNADRVTYEVHQGTTAGFATSVGTKVAESDGTIVTLLKDAAGSTFAYSGTTYYFKVIAKDDDGAAAAGTVSAGVNPRKAGTGDITTIIADQIGTGSLSSAIITIASGGKIQSTGYVANTSGFMISDTAVDIQAGVINFGTLRAGTVNTTGLSIGAGGMLTVDSTGAIQSNNYASNSTGWKLSSSGLELNSGTVKAAALTGGTFTGGNFIVGSGGAVQSSNYNGTSAGWNLTDTGLTIYNGTIKGATVRTNQLMSNTTGAPSPSGYTFSLNAYGYLEVSGAYIYGNTTVAGTASHYIQSGTYSPGTAGWKISGTGTAEFSSLSIYGGTTLGSVSYTGAYIKSYNYNGTNTGWQIGANGSATFYGGTISGGNVVGSTIETAVEPGLNTYLSLYKGVLTVKSSTATYGTISAVSSGGVNGIIMQAPTANGGIVDVMKNGAVDLWSWNGKDISLNANSGTVKVVSGNLSLNNNNIVGVTNLTVNGTINGSPTFTGTPTWANPDAATGTANVNWNGGKLRQAASSAAKYKYNIHPLTDVLDAETVVSLEPVAFKYHAWHAANAHKEYFGFVADMASKIEKLDIFVEYTEDGEVENFDYAKFSSAQQLVLRQHHEEIKELKSEISELKNQVNRLLGKS